jgi:single-strand DNA-binding protein
MNKFIVTGNLVRDSELRFSPSGVAVNKFTIANNEGWGDKKTVNFFNCTAFKATAEAIANYTHKGSKVLIEGKIQLGSYEKKDGSGKQYTTDVIVNQIEFLDSKKETSNAPSGNSNHFSDFPDEEDVFTPVDDSEDIPF